MRYWLLSVILAISFHYPLAPLIIAISAKAKSLQYVSGILLDPPFQLPTLIEDLMYLSYIVMYVFRLRMYRNHTDFLSNM